MYYCKLLLNRLTLEMLPLNIDSLFLFAIHLDIKINNDHQGFLLPLAWTLK